MSSDPSSDDWPSAGSITADESSTPANNVIPEDLQNYSMMSVQLLTLR
jgi:hypothetical protein